MSLDEIKHEKQLLDIYLSSRCKPLEYTITAKELKNKEEIICMTEAIICEADINKNLQTILLI